MLEDSEDPVVKTVQPTIKTGRKWKVVETVDEAKMCLQIKEVIGQTQTIRKELGSSRAKWWSNQKGKGKETWSSMRYGSMKIPEGFRKQSTNLNRDNGLTGIMLCRNEISHMAPLRISFLVRSVYGFLPSNANLVRWEKKEDPTCPLCQCKQTTEHVLSSCKIALSHGRYTWRHNRDL